MNKSKVLIIILCGGKGVRLRPLTKVVPKPLLKIENKPFLFYILNHINQFFKNKKIKIVIATGYKKHLFSQYVKKNSKKFRNLEINSFNTGVNNDIIKRIIKIKKKFNDFNHYLILYGDTYININIKKYISFAMKNKHSTSVAIPLNSNFGLYDIMHDKVIEFKEKPTLDKWINVGYFLFSNNALIAANKFLKFSEFIKNMVKKKQLNIFKHYGSHITYNSLGEYLELKNKIKKIK